MNCERRKLTGRMRGLGGRRKCVLKEEERWKGEVLM